MKSFTVMASLVALFIIEASPARAACNGTPLEGIDVSVYQGTVAWDKVKTSGRAFAIARVSDGSYIDTEFATNWPAMKKAGLVRGAYQFFEPAEDAATQAAIVVTRVGMLGAGDLPVTLDMEVDGGKSPAEIVASIHTWADAIAAGTGKTPMIYTAYGFWDSAVNSSDFAQYPLWVANWGVSCPSLPTGWSTFNLWQYADNGTVSGISGDVDLDRFYGTQAELDALAGGGVTGPDWAAKYVSQSFPYATSAIPLTVNETLSATLEMKNTGAKAWDSNTRLATSQPRDRDSPFVGADWISPSRLAAVSGTVPPGSSYTFSFTFQAPSVPGLYMEYFGMVEEGVAWFSDPAQGGPPDDQLEALFQVSAAPDMAAPVDMRIAPDLHEAADLRSENGPDLRSGKNADLGFGQSELGQIADIVDLVNGEESADLSTPRVGATPRGGCGCRIGARRAAGNPIQICVWVFLGLLMARTRYARARG